MCNVIFNLSYIFEKLRKKLDLHIVSLQNMYPLWLLSNTKKIQNTRGCASKRDISDAKW